MYFLIKNPASGKSHAVWGPGSVLECRQKVADIEGVPLDHVTLESDMTVVVKKPNPLKLGKYNRIPTVFKVRNKADLR